MSGKNVPKRSHTPCRVEGQARRRPERMIMSDQNVSTTDAQHEEWREPSIKIPQKQMRDHVWQS